MHWWEKCTKNGKSKKEMLAAGELWPITFEQLLAISHYQLYTPFPPPTHTASMLLRAVQPVFSGTHCPHRHELLLSTDCCLGILYVKKNVYSMKWSTLKL